MSLAISEIGPDLVHFQSATFLHDRGVNKCLAQLKNPPLVTTVHDTPRSPRVFYTIPNLREIYRKSRAIVTHSKGVLETLNRYHRVPVNKLSLVPLGVDIDRFHPDADRRRVQVIYNLLGKRVILFFGFLRPGKGLETLLAAWAKTSRRSHDAVLVIAGDSPSRTMRYGLLAEREQDYPSFLRDLAKQLGLSTEVVFTGHVPDDLVPGLLTNADVVVFPNDTNLSQSYPLHQALGAGAAILTTTSPASEEVLVDGKNALLVPPRNVEALCAGLDLLMRDEVLRKRMKVSARATAVERCSWTHISDRLIRIYRDVAQ
jgi:glycosyltransferase involved in cell wall biosynthesis